MPPRPTRTPTSTVAAPGTRPTHSAPAVEPLVRGYLTTPRELERIAERARAGAEPYKTAMAAQLTFASEVFNEEPRDTPGTLKIT